MEIILVVFNTNLMLAVLNTNSIELLVLQDLVVTYILIIQ